MSSNRPLGAEGGLLGAQGMGSDPRTRDLQLAVNVSAQEFNRLDFVETVEKTLAETGAQGRPAHAGADRARDA